MAKGLLKLQATGGLSSPLTNYTGDFLPLSIGLHCQTASLRGILNYTHKKGYYITAQAGHTWRSNIKIDRDAYLFDNKLVYSDIMPVPNVVDYSFHLGFINPQLQTEFTYDAFTGLSGDDIRYNEAPQACNKMVGGQVSWFGKYFITKQLSLFATVGKVVNGRNIGEAFLNWSAGTTYFIDVK